MNDTLEYITCPYCRNDVQRLDYCPVCLSPLGSHGDDPLGHRVGDYVLEKLLAEGANGQLYRAYHIATGSWVALKLLRPHLLDHPKSIRRLRREAEIGIRLQHIHAVKLFAFGIDPVFGPFLVMELIVGQTLQQLLEEVGSLDVARTIAISLQLCEVLDKAHHLSIVHRDLKPSNIMLQWHPSTKDFVKVCDFGLAKLDLYDVEETQLTIPGTIHGTPAYMSPEQCRGKETTPLSDVYSLGIVIYEMLTGRLPFDHCNVSELLHQQLFSAPPPLHEVAPHLQSFDHLPLLQSIVFRCLQKQAEYRYHSVDELRQELALLLPSYTPLDLDVQDNVSLYTPTPPTAVPYQAISIKPEELEPILSWIKQAPVKIYLPDQRLFQTGQHAHRWYWLKHGEVRLFQHTEQHVVELDRLGPGHFLGVSPFFAQTPYPVSAAATERSELYEIDQVFLQHEAPETNFWNLLQTLCYEDSLQQLIRYSPFFTYLPVEQRYSLLQQGHLYNYAPQQTVLVAQQEVQGLFFVITGQIDYQPLRSMSQFSNTLLLAGECFGEVSLLSQQPSEGTYLALTHSSLLYLERQQLDPLFAQYPHVYKFLQTRAEQRIAQWIQPDISLQNTTVDDS